MPLQRHNAMKSRKNRSGVAFTDAEKISVISNVEKLQSESFPEAKDRRKEGQNVSDEVRAQVQQAKTSMEDNIAKVEKTGKRLDEIDIYASPRVTKCRSLDDLTGDKTDGMREENRPASGDHITIKAKEKIAELPPGKSIGNKSNANVLSEPKHKKKKPIPTSTDESESKIAFVKKKAKRAKVFLKEKLTDHSNSTDGSKQYRQNDGNNTTVFYTDESIATPMPKQPVVSSTCQQPQKQQQQSQQQAKTTQLDILRSQVQEVTNIMKDNVDEISRRGEKLEELETRSGRLEDLSSSFSTTAAAIQKKMKRRNRKVICAIALVLTLVLIIVTVVLVVYYNG